MSSSASRSDEDQPLRLEEGGADKDVVIRLIPEALRVIAYSCFWFVVILGIILTRFFSGIDMDKTLLMQVFGYNNICVNFDFPPSTYVLPFFWAITLTVLLVYQFSLWLQFREEWELGKLTLRRYRILCGFKVFECLTMAFFSMIFAVSPTGWDETLFIHTIPFSCLQVGLVLLGCSNMYHGLVSGYFDSLELPKWHTASTYFYLVCYVIIVGFKIPASYNAMFHQPLWKQTPTFNVVAGLFDRWYLIWAAICPLVHSIWILRTRYDKVKIIELRVDFLGQAA